MTALQTARKYRPDLPWTTSGDGNIAKVVQKSYLSISLVRVQVPIGSKLCAWELFWYEKGGRVTMRGSTLESKFEYLKGYAATRHAGLTQDVELCRLIGEL